MASGASVGGAYQPDANYTRTGATDTGGTYSGATLASPTLTSPTISGTTAIGSGATLTSPTLTSPTISTPRTTMTFASVAGAGTTVADATAITSGSGALILGTGGNGTVGIKFPTGTAGMYYVVKNDDAANGILKIYAASGGKVNGGSADAALSMAAKTCAMFLCIAADSWVSLSLLPS